jgi:hypothetical protein
MRHFAHDLSAVPPYAFDVVAEESARIEVVNPYQWAGNPRFARFHVYVDGKKVGSAPPLGGSFQTNLSSGSHRVRVRFWWFLIPPVLIDVAPGKSVRLTGDIPRELSVPKRMARMGVHPATSLKLSH